MIIVVFQEDDPQLTFNLTQSLYRNKKISKLPKRQSEIIFYFILFYFWVAVF